MLAGGQALFDLELEGSKAVPVVVKEQQLHPVRGNLQHIDLQEVKLDEAIQAEVAIELEGAEAAPGVKEGGVLEHVTREITVEALPTEIPERLVADVSAMEINDTLQLSTIAAPEGVKFVADDLDEVTIATLSPPRVEEEPEPAVEEEAELVGEEGEAPAAEEGGEAARAATRATPAGSSRPLSIFRRRGGRGEAEGEATASSIVGLGNPGAEHAGSRHNVGFEVGAELSRRWDLPRAKKKFGGLIAEGRARPGGPRVAILLPQTYMNASGDSAGPARGSLKAPLDRVVVLHDEIDLPFGEVQSRLGGGLAGHNGLKSLKRGLGSAEFWRVRVGVGRPDSTDPEIVSAYVLGRFREPRAEVEALVGCRRRRGRAPRRASRLQHADER